MIQYALVILPSTLRALNFFLNPLTAGAAYIRVFIFYWHVKYHVLNMVELSCDISKI